MNLDQLFAFTTWGFGVCVLGFFFLARQLWQMVGLIKNSEKDVSSELKTISGDVSEMTKALVGTIEKKGFVTRHYDLERRVETIEKNCSHNQGD